MWYDVVCLVILALSIWRGMVKGFVWQLATIAGIVICFAFAETVSIAIAPMTGLEPPLSRWVSILGLYVVSSFVAFAFARTVKTGLEKAQFEDYDRHLGAIFGFVKGGLFCLIVSFFMFTLSDKTREAVMHSHGGYASAVLFDQIRPVMPEELHALLEPYMEGFDKDSIVQHRKEHPVDEHGHHIHDEGEGGHEDHDGHDHGSSDDSDGPHAPNPFENTGSDGKKSRTLEEMVQQIPGVFGQELERIIYETLQNTSPEHRQELLNEMSSGLPGVIRQVAEEWKNGRPNEPETPSTAEADWKQYRAELLRRIAAIYTEHPEAQRAIMEEVVYSLRGVPDAVTVAVLEDWHADLTNKQPDPDPSTDVYTRLDRRVLSQITKARISLGSLPDDLQSRLQDLR